MVPQSTYLAVRGSIQSLHPTIYTLKGAISVQSETGKTRLFVLGLMNLSFLLLGSNAVAQQSIEDNVRPVGQVCLAGQPCVGTTAGRAATAAVAASTTSIAAPATAIAEEIVEEVVEVVAAATEVKAFDVESTYQMSCFACHGTGAAGAPILGDAEAWAPRMEKGMDAVMANVVNGVNAMPPKGLCFTCTDEDLATLVTYMSSQ
jgi:cytochrome c5